MADIPIEVWPTALIVDYGFVFDEKRRPRWFFGLFQITGKHGGSLGKSLGGLAEYVRHIIVRPADSGPGNR